MDASEDANFDAACSPGEKACDELQVVECSPSGTWQLGEGCASACVDGACACALPWGGVLANGQSVTAYLHPTELSPDLCVLNAETRTCAGNVLTGSYAHPACDQLYRSCSLAGYGTLQHGEQVTSYDAPSVPCGSTCTQSTISCSDGSLQGGSAYYATCAAEACCGPYPDITVTGTTSGSVWGSNPYTDDSAWGVAAVHAGLLAVGQTGTLKRTSVGYMTGFPGSTQNGVTTSTWSSGWCGVYLSY